MLSTTTKNDCDAALMQQVHAGDESAVSDLYDRFAGSIYGTVRRALWSSADADDIGVPGGMECHQETALGDEGKLPFFR